MTILGIDPKFGLSNLRSNSKILIQVGTNNISRSSDEEEALWEPMNRGSHVADRPDQHLGA